MSQKKMMMTRKCSLENKIYQSKLTDLDNYTPKNLVYSAYNNLFLKVVELYCGKIGLGTA